MIALETKPGTEVICIKSPTRSPRCPTALTVGRVYTVADWTTELMTGKPLVDLVENYHEEWAWGRECFRQLDIAGLDALLADHAKEPTP